jgi:hypothetical protein
MEEWGLIKTLLVAELRFNSWRIIKVLLILIPTFAIISLFATYQWMPYANQVIFLRNSGHDFLQFTEGSYEDQTFHVLEVPIDANVEGDKYQGYWRKNSYRIELFVADNATFDFNSTYFSNRNFLRGNPNHLSDHEGMTGIALSYNALKRLNANVGDSVTLRFTNGERGTFKLPAIIQGVLRTKYPEHSIGFGGLGLVVSNNLVEEALLNNPNLPFRHVRFGQGTSSQLENSLSRRDQIRYASQPSYYLPNMGNMGLWVMFALGVLALFIVNSRELQFAIKQNWRKIGILRALGATNKLIVKIFVIGQACSIAIAALSGGLLYRALFMLGQYVDLRVMMGVVLGLFAIGLICLLLAAQRVRKVVANCPIIDIIYNKEF